MKTNFSRSALVAALLVSVSSAVLADNVPITGTPPLSSIAGGPFDSIDLANLNVHFSIPVFSRSGVGIPFSYNLSYDSLVWINPGPGGQWVPAPADPGLANWGWRAVTEAITGWVEYRSQSGTDCETDYSDFLYHDANGGVHSFNGTVRRIIHSPVLGCDGQAQIIPITNAPALDNSGYILTTNAAQATVNSSSGLTIQVPPVLSETGAGSVTDANGNRISITVNGSTTTIVDTLNTTALTISNNPPTNPLSCSPDVKYQYTAPSGALATVTVHYLGYTVQTNFGISGVREFGPTNECLVDKVWLSDGTHYQFMYELTKGTSGTVTGRIASVTLPTGGTITYSYAGSGCGTHNCMMADGSSSYLTRNLGGGTWTYTRAIQSGQQLPQTTLTVLDPASNETDLKFSSIYETERKVYEGPASQNQILDYSYTCYNLNYSDSTCPTAVITAPPAGSGWSRGHNGHANQITFNWPYSSVWDYYDTYGNLTGETDYTYASPPKLIRTITNHYNGCTAQNICNELANSQITDGGGASKSYTTYSYDEGGGTHGLVTSINRSTTGSTSGPFLSQHYSYNSNSTPKTATDPNGTVTYYNSTGYSCNSGFPNSVTAAGLQTQYQYNCTGGVVTQTTDSNSAVVSTSYSDPDYWRPASTTDALRTNTTYYNYYGVRNAPTSTVTVPGQTESVLSWTGSTADALITPDSYGRPWLQQQLNPQSTWDTVQKFYDISGRVVFVSLPFTTSAGPGGASGGHLPVTGYLYDNLGRYTQIFHCNGVDCGGANTTYSYNQNDVEISTGPGQTTFSKELEYDILGRVTSVCEMSTSLSGVGACSQNTPQTGYRTTYTYDPLGDLTSVTQGAQTRSYSYDGLGRMFSETNPESGTKTYTYDSVGTGYCPAGAYSSPGDLVETSDANGNNICYYYYDGGLHRLTDVGNNHQSATNVCHRFRYDNSSGYLGKPSGVSPQNSLGRLVEAETDDCQRHTITDEWFSYTKRGETTDQWTSTPNSGGWYHVQQSYFPNSVMASLRGFTGTGTSSPFSDLFTYSLDTEGRSYSMVDTTTGSSIWASTTYNAANQPLSVQQSAGGGETFAYGGSYGDTTYTNVMKLWQSTAGSQHQTGTLTWNSNGTLYELAITDPFNSANAQTCYYSYDDLARLSANSCQGSPGIAESYSYDRYGNISTSDSRGSYYSFPATYNTSNNHITNPYANYDADGNILEDNEFNIFQYDVYNRPVILNAEPVTFDAFNREVESGPGYTQFVYAPDGSKFAYMNRQTLIKYMDPMVAGMQAEHVHATPRDYGYFVHTDWLGSSRLGVTGGGTVEYDRAFTPFGEPYAELNNEGKDNRSFTGQNEDITSGIYDFPLRQQSQDQGRWFVPDPAGLAAVDITNPQTWNRYGYVGNAPLTDVDPLGLEDDACEDYECGGFAGGGGGGGPSGGGDADGGGGGGDPGDGSTGISLNPGDNTGVTDIPLPNNPDDDAPDGPTPTDPASSTPQYTFYAQGTAKFPGVPTIPSTVDDWIHPIELPVSSAWSYGNWCGAGGAGKPIDPTDNNCMNHDHCLEKLGIDANDLTANKFANLPAWLQQAVQSCNQQLCNGINAEHISWWDVHQQIAAWEINKYFHNFVPAAAACH